MTFPICTVFVDANVAAGPAIVGATVRATLSGTEMYEGAVVPDIVVATTDATGRAELPLFPNVLGALGSYYQLSIERPGALPVVLFLVVPAMAQAWLYECQVSRVPPPIVPRSVPLPPPPVSAPPPAPEVPLLDLLLADARVAAEADGAEGYVLLPSLAGAYQDDVAGTPAAVGAPLGRLVNLRAAGAVASQSVPASRPDVVALTNGNPAASFDVPDKHLVLPVGNGAIGTIILAGASNTVTSPAGWIGNRSTGQSIPGVVVRSGTLSAGQGYQIVIGDGVASNSADVIAPLNVPAVLSARWDATEVALRLDGAAEVVTAHARNVVNATPLALGRHRASHATNGMQGPAVLAYVAPVVSSEANRRAVERLGAHLMGKTMVYDQAPVLADLEAYRTSATTFAGIPYASDAMAWAEDTAGGAIWYPRINVYLPAGTPPPGGWPVSAYAHPNGSTFNIADGSSTALKVRDPLVAAGIALASIEFPHPVASKLGMGARYLEAYDYIGWAIQKLRSIGAALGLATDVIGMTCRSRGSLAGYTALAADKRKRVGTHQEQQSSLIQHVYMVNGQTYHDAEDAINRYVIPGDRAAALALHPGDATVLNMVDLVATAPQVPSMYLVSNLPYFVTQQTLAVFEANYVHYPDMLLSLKQAMVAAGHADLVTDAPATPDGSEFNNLVAWMQARL